MKSRDEIAKILEDAEFDKDFSEHLANALVKILAPTPEDTLNFYNKIK